MFSIKTGNKNTAIGSLAQNTFDMDNQIAIGADSRSTLANQCIIGNVLVSEISNMGNGTCDLGHPDRKFKDIYANGNIYYNQANPALRATANENVNVSDTFLFLNNKIDRAIGSFVSFGGKEVNILSNRHFFNVNGDSTSSTSSSFSYDNTFIIPFNCTIGNISFIKRNTPLIAVQVVINQVIDELNIIELDGRYGITQTNIDLQKGDIINLCFRNNYGVPDFGKYTLYLEPREIILEEPPNQSTVFTFDENDLIPPAKSLQDRIEELENRLNELTN